MLELRDVTVGVSGETHIHPTNLVLESGRFNVLLGTTLSGKTTLLQLMAGLVRPTSGSVLFGGTDVTGVPVRRRNVSMVYQQFINYPNMSVYENIASPLRVAGLSSSDIDSRVNQMAELLKISELLERRPSELSGGQQQRTAIARALVKDSDLILLDEPLANLDFKLREELRDELPRIFGERDCVVVYATTEPTEALLLGGWTAALHEGAVADFGAGIEIYRQPKNLKSAMVFSEPPLNIADVEKRGERVIMNDSVSWSIDSSLLSDGAYVMGVRPHHVTPDSRDNAVGITGRVKVAELSGSESIIHFDSSDGRPWVSLSHGIHPFPVGEEARLYFDSSRCLYFDSDGALAYGGA